MFTESNLTLVLDAAAASGTVAVLRGSTVIAEGEAVMRSGEREFLLPTVHASLARAGAAVSALTAVVCGSGPGSFTSLRIAGSIAKGIAHARRIPLMTVPSLGLLVAERARPAGRYVAAIDALRGEHYVALAQVGDDGAVRLEESFELVASKDLAAYAASKQATLVGGLSGESAHPHARGAARMQPTVVDLAAWEPTYGRVAEAQARWEATHGRPLHAE